MTQFRTHYDNLKVARSAPPEVIRAAYRALSQSFHPDRNPGDADAARVMAIINGSYEVLSDPDKRRAHDRWIAEQELPSGRAQEPKSSSSRQPRTRQPAVSRRGAGRAIPHGRYWLLYGFAVFFFVWLVVRNATAVPPPGPKPFRETTTPAEPQFVRPATAPNGSAWPAAAGYVEGYQRLQANGLSTVTVDNSQNDSDVFVKLVSLNGQVAYPVRQFYVSAFGRFTVDKITAGTYDVRYRDLSTGALSRSEAFSLEEEPTTNGTQFSAITMTLYKVQNGNMETYPLSDAEF
jgi:hypothetical protein